MHEPTTLPPEKALITGGCVPDEDGKAGKLLGRPLKHLVSGEAGVEGAPGGEQHQPAVLSGPAAGEAVADDEVCLEAVEAAQLDRRPLGKSLGLRVLYRLMRGEGLGQTNPGKEPLRVTIIGYPAGFAGSARKLGENVHEVMVTEESLAAQS